MEDREIVDLLRRGDPRGVEAMLVKYGPNVKRGLCRRHRRQEGDESVEDAVHDAALIVFRNARRIDRHRSLFGYFATIARHGLLRKINPDNSVPLPPDAILGTMPAESQASGPPTPFVRALRRFMKKKLSPLEHAVLQLLSSSNFTLSSKEIAELLETTPHTVDVAKYRAKKKLGRVLNDWEKRKANAKAPKDPEDPEPDEHCGEGEGV